MSKIQTLKSVIDTVKEGSRDTEIISAANLLVQVLRSKLHIGCFTRLHPLYDPELSLCTNSLQFLQDAEGEGEGGLYDDFNEIVERLTEWAEGNGVSI